MALIVLSETPTGAVSCQMISASATTATALVDPIFSSIIRATNNIAMTPRNFNIADLDSAGFVSAGRNAVPGILTGRRPKFGQLFPRGYYNR